jgi:3-phenylpropionate/trans-cinnamate dioxygenase ferredoxin reductase subunit
MAPRILQRVASAETSDFFRDLHRAHGVKLIEATGLERLIGEDHVTAARLTDARELLADFVIVGVGITPATELAQSSGIRIENGIVTDALGRTSAPNVWAAGDCASFPTAAGQMRLESVPNAIDQAECIAANILGANKAYVPEPWFWSDQFDIKLQIAGLNIGYDTIVTRRTDGAVSFWYYKGVQLLAVDAMNDPRAFMVAKRLLAMGKSPAAALVADPETELKALLK